MKSVDVLISTANDRIENLNNLIQKHRAEVNYIIAHQISKVGEIEEELNFIHDRNDIYYYKSFEKGISKNRNLAMSKSKSDICIIADDDVKYFQDSFEIVRNYHKEYKNAGVIIFQIEASDDNLPFKKYQNKMRWLNKKDAYKVNSIEITYKRKIVQNKKIKFNENFGLGSSLTGGEENLFILDCINNDIKVLYVPVPIVLHPRETSGQNRSLSYSEKGIRNRAANAYIYYGIFYKLYIIYFLLKHRKYYKQSYDMKDCYIIMKEGIAIAKEATK